MKKIFTLLVLLLPVMVFGQSRQSNKFFKQGTKLYKAEKYEEAIPYFQKSDSLDKAQLDPTAENYYRAELKMADCCHNLSCEKYDEGKYTEAIKLETLALEIRRRVLDEEYTDYATSLHCLALYNDAMGNYTEAIRLGTIATEIRKKILGEEHIDYAKTIANLAISNSRIGNYTEAARLGTIAMEIFKKCLGEEHPYYAAMLLNIASNNSLIGNYTEAIRLGTIAMEIRKKILGEEHPDYAESLIGLAKFKSDLGNDAEAIRLGTIAMEIFKKKLGEEHPYYAMALSSLASYNSYIGNYTEAIRLGTIALKIRKKVLGEEHPDYAESLSSLASYNSYIGNYTEAIRLGTIATEIYKKVFGEDNPYYAWSLSNQASYNSDIGNYNEAIRLGTIALEIYKKVSGEEDRDYATATCFLAIYNSYIGNYNEAIRLGTIALEIYKKILGEESPDYAGSLNNLAYYNSCAGNDTDAVRLGTVAVEILKKVLGEEHPNYANSIYHLANFNLQSGKIDDASKYYNQFYERTTAYILKNFALMTSKERTDFWNMRYEFSYTRSGFFSIDLPYVAYKINNADLNALAYNSQVFSKGLLLNAELEIQKLIEQSHDTTFVKRYYKIKQNRAKLDELYQLALNARTLNTDSLLKVIDNEERLLVQSSKSLGDYTKNLSIDWHDVQKNLKDSDLAIEFANFKDTSKQQIYVALVLKKGMKTPELVTLFTQDDFYDIPSDEYYKTTKLYNLVWEPLEKYLREVKNVYFSPCGKFHTIGIEYLPDESGKIFAEKFNAYRLSSTRELALSKEINPNKKAATYGGIKYGEDNNGTGKRGVATYLKGSKIESDTVAKLLRSADYEVIALSDTVATEESFKKLSGTNLKILHIGTHGFYYSESDLENAGFSFFSNNKQQSEEDKAMSCSGLLFAGANFALDTENRSALPEGDDGILTAKEISRLDFQGLDLVVLSACQTGLGEVTGEGVFGLQRGFKKAGAQTIIMSLWEVDDYATRLLMTEFFKGLTLGKSKREAFLAALNYVKAKNSDPKYWAAFVMVDGE